MAEPRPATEEAGKPESIECPRCGGSALDQLAHSPVPGIWEVWGCQRCRYSWRSTEPLANRSRAHYPERFRLTPAQLDAAREVPPVPTRDSSSS